MNPDGLGKVELVAFKERITGEKRKSTLPFFFLMKPLVFHTLVVFIAPFQYRAHILTLWLCPQKANRQQGASEEEKKTEMKG